MRLIRARTVALLAALSVAVAAPVAAASAQTGIPSAQVACKSATIVGKHKCIARGQFCKHTSRANKDYHRYGYHCGKRDRNGRYHLKYY
jgi:uncharacterized membrane protein